MWHWEPTLSRYTSETDETEWNLAFHYAAELRRWLPWLDCDFDVSKRNLDRERPDIIFHRRKTHALNFLVIEVKRERSRKAVPADLDQIRDRWFARMGYRFGASVILDEDRQTAEIGVLSSRDGERDPEWLKADAKVLFGERPHSAEYHDVFCKLMMAAENSRDEREFAELEAAIDEQIFRLFGVAH